MVRANFLNVCRLVPEKPWTAGEVLLPRDAAVAGGLGAALRARAPVLPPERRHAPRPETPLPLNGAPLYIKHHLMVRHYR